MKTKFMDLAIKEAMKAYKKNEVPVGAIIVKNNKVLAKAHNLKEKKNKVTKHAEILCIEKASRKLKNWRLDGCELYVTLLPCVMCTGAIIQSRIDNVIYCSGIGDQKEEETILSLFNTNTANPNISVKQLKYSNKCSTMLQEFFNRKRLEK